MLAVFVVKEQFELIFNIPSCRAFVVPSIDEIAELVCLVEACDETSPRSNVVNEARLDIRCAQVAHACVELDDEPPITLEHIAQCQILHKMIVEPLRCFFASSGSLHHVLFHQHILVTIDQDHDERSAIVEGVLFVF